MRVRYVREVRTLPTPKPEQLRVLYLTANPEQNPRLGDLWLDQVERDDVNPFIKQVRESVPQFGEIEETPACIEVDEEIDVVVRAVVPTRNGPEGCTPHASRHIPAAPA